MAEKSVTQNDAAWRRLLDAKGIQLAAATFPLVFDMEDMKRLGGREPRLMNSMDSREKWPPVLRKHSVFPLSLDRSRVALVKGEPFLDFIGAASAPTDYAARLPIRFLSSTIGQGENAHIMRLHLSGFLQSFLGGSTLFATASGRRVSPAFTVLIAGTPVQVDGAQYEIDGQYESEEDLVAVEMKPRPYGSCAIKQVYLPYRSLGEDAEWQKPVRPLYITFNPRDESYIVREMRFARREVWESLHVERETCVRLKVTSPPRRLLNLSAPPLPATRVPQADAPWRLQELPGLVKRGINNADLVAEALAFDPRQSNYYRDAAQMLGLLEQEQKAYVLTTDGRRFADQSPQAQADELARRMSRLPVMNAVLVSLEDSGLRGLSPAEIEQVLGKFAALHKEPVSGSTLRRRAQTVRAWLRFIGSRTGALVYTGKRFYLRQNVQQLDDFSAEE